MPASISGRVLATRPADAASDGSVTILSRPGTRGFDSVCPAPRVAMSEKAFASQADLVEKTVSFDRLSDHAYA